MKYEKVEVYRCKCCMEHYTLDEESMQEHLTQCLANPDNKACIMCKHIRRITDLNANGKPFNEYKCMNPLVEKDVLDEYVDLRLTGATCFEDRGTPTMEFINTPEYERYLANMVINIKGEMSSSQEE